MRHRFVYVLLGVLLAAGCSGVTSPASLDGTWEWDTNIRGSSSVITLTTSGDAVSGTEVWAGEACCSGTNTITGDKAGASLRLTFVTVTTSLTHFPPGTSQFSGTFDGNKIIGKFVGDSLPERVYLRTN